MEDFGSLWDFEENIDELRQKVLVMAYELESTKKQADEEMKKNKDKLLQLLNLLQTAYKERDEARDQLQGLLLNYNTTTPDHPHFCNSNNNSTPTPTTTFTPLSPESPLRLIPTTATTTATTTTTATVTATAKTTAAGTGCNSCTTASNSPSVDSFFDPPAVSSPDLSASFTAGVMVGSTSADNHHHPTTNSIHHPPLQASLVRDFSSSLPPLAPTPLIYPDPTTTTRTTSPGGAYKTDQASTIICSTLAKGRPLPQKGRLLQAVIEAGPLLQTVMVAGPLPRWRNPPPALPLPTFGNADTNYNCPVLGRATTVAALNSTYLAAAAKGSYNSMNSSGNYAQMSCGGSSQMYQTATNMLNFGVGSSAAAGGLSIGGGRRRMTTTTSGSTGIHNFINNQISIPKRQRIQ